MSAKPLTFALIVGRGLSKSAEAHTPARAASAASARRVVPPPPPAFDPAKAFVDLGCSGCHGDDGIYRDEIKGALGKPVDQVGRWIRNAPSIKSDTDMPNFENVIDTPHSEALAHWVMDRAAHLD
jgi:mono/diheme cytochrome c family protein